MRALILAAGRGSRLHPYTDTVPKCLTEIAGITLIERQITTLRACGIKDIVIVTGYLADHLKLPDTHQIHNPRWMETNMVESLFCAVEEFTDDLIVSYSDIVYERRVLEALLRSQSNISVAVDKNWRAYWEFRFADPLSDAESLRLDVEGRITDIGLPVDDIDGIEAQYIGLMRFRGDGVDILTQTKQELGFRRRAWMDERPIEKAYMTDLLMEMVLTGVDVHAVPIAGGWLEIDTVKDYRDIAELYESGDISRFYDAQA